jgi:hypothetical protein
MYNLWHYIINKTLANVNRCSIVISELWKGRRSQPPIMQMSPNQLYLFTHRYLHSEEVLNDTKLINIKNIDLVQKRLTSIVPPDPIKKIIKQKRFKS